MGLKLRVDPKLAGERDVIVNREKQPAIPHRINLYVAVALGNGKYSALKTATPTRDERGCSRCASNGRVKDCVISSG